VLSALQTMRIALGLRGCGDRSRGGDRGGRGGRVFVQISEFEL
jgi:hypothetical protein